MRSPALEGRLWFSDWGTQEIVAVDVDGNREVPPVVQRIVREKRGASSNRVEWDAPPLLSRATRDGPAASARKASRSHAIRATPSGAPSDIFRNRIRRPGWQWTATIPHTAQIANATEADISTVAPKARIESRELSEIIRRAGIQPAAQRLNWRFRSRASRLLPKSRHGNPDERQLDGARIGCAMGVSQY